jgi:hypothetical protein
MPTEPGWGHPEVGLESTKGRGQELHVGPFDEASDAEKNLRTML